MSKKKSEKEAKEKKQSAKKSAVKPVPAPGVAEAVELTEAKPKARKPKEAPLKKAGKAAEISGEAIKLRAYFIAERRAKMGWHGDSTGDWVEAERQLKAEAARKK